MKYLYDGTNTIQTACVFLLLLLVTVVYSAWRRQGLSAFREQPRLYLAVMFEFLLMWTYFWVRVLGLVKVEEDRVLVSAPADFILSRYGIALDWSASAGWMLFSVSLVLNVLLSFEESPVLAFLMLALTALLGLVLASHYAPGLVVLLAKVLFMRIPLLGHGAVIVPEASQ